ncbi:universal stress protein (plasmid) [Haloferax mediterranei ATCC 33500]|uniref:Universal stress protein n=1 Tax=Haloferax mediterranei (strain ATCC 33500 / DSM 1411 / JCM 8866 / NBRC 14739 / NCIMB 2177 / R-4) TaxID=523841 RepID=I3RA02_HALMT|nr:universal stress protein [Haloferax mediterranei]AFK21062.1 universal stress protein UspA-like protein [Haloferax mediterranei ATCC 33500]AHZ24081.1 universal stress protein UspA [Haloferax mediterranei ATCC 33500]EMA05154.1 universal stress protein UspA-like protein [Haloferax mediterranei ATCC 33500]MDX5989770.1 universal stress protein [Haloferax mediterranei ATCC 33500]QCQ77217.1 universal stress protein [Haloferax mediterranei ATCC 33500]
MYDEILLPMDGSSEAEAAVVRALDLARIGDATVHILYVVDTSPEPPGLGSSARDELRNYSERRGRDMTQQVQKRADESGIAAVRTVSEGIPHRVITKYIEANDIDLVMMGTHGEAGRGEFLTGRATERVVALSDVPVMSVRVAPDVTVPTEGYAMYDDVVVATDGSDAAERAAEHGLGIAERYGADVHVVYVIDTTTYGLGDAPRSIVGLLKQGGQNAITDIETTARDRNLPVTTTVLRGVPEDEILSYADGVDADVITLGTRGRSAGPEHLLGSTTARLVGRSDIPVFTTS